MVLLDEIEKAHPDVFNILLQVLEDGRLTDGQGRTVDFTNTVLIMTSNIPGEPHRALQAGVRQPDRRDRPLPQPTEADLNRIVTIQLQGLRGRLAERRLALEVTPAAEPLLAHNGFDPDFGARPLRRVIQRQVEDPLALALLEGRYPEGSTVTVDEQDGAVVLVRAGPVADCGWRSVAAGRPPGAGGRLVADGSAGRLLGRIARKPAATGIHWCVIRILDGGVTRAGNRRGRDPVG